MLFSDEYKTISNEAESNIVEQSSRFLAFAYNVSNETQVKQYLIKLKSKFPDATHHCYAYILNPDKSYIKINDDGEPSGTAGRPILIQINKSNLTNILLVVVRYFGGKKLGIPGLISAYSNAAMLCLSNATIINKKLMDYYHIKIPSEKNFEMYNLVKKYNAKIVDSSLGEKAEFTISISKTLSNKFIEECNINYKFEVKYLKTE
ncbi:MAG: YigZ family protein [Bacteroidia bacterium]|nr:YigZ family protein [Bacteroidia bacterium]